MWKCSTLSKTDVKMFHILKHWCENVPYFDTLMWKCSTLSKTDVKMFHMKMFQNVPSCETLMWKCSMLSNIRKPVNTCETEENIWIHLQSYCWTAQVFLVWICPSKSLRSVISWHSFATWSGGTVVSKWLEKQYKCTIPCIRGENWVSWGSTIALFDDKHYLILVPWTLNRLLQSTLSVDELWKCVCWWTKANCLTLKFGCMLLWVILICKKQKICFRWREMSWLLFFNSEHGLWIAKTKLWKSTGSQSVYEAWFIGLS